jgi:hypothetical protein
VKCMGDIVDDDCHKTSNHWVKEPWLGLPKGTSGSRLDKGAAWRIRALVRGAQSNVECQPQLPNISD